MDPIAQFYEHLWHRIDWAVQLSLYWAEDIALEILEPFLVRGMWWEYIDICWKHAVKARKYEANPSSNYSIQYSEPQRRHHERRQL